MFCNKCGKELPDDAKFCKGCGVSVSRREPGKAQIKAQIKAPAETSKEAPVESVGSVESAESMESGLKKKSNGVKWWIFGGAAAALAVVAVLLVVVLGGKGKLFEGSDGLTEELAVGLDDVRSDDSWETPQLSLCFREAIFKQGLPDARVFLTSGHDNPEGEIVAEFTTQPDGTVQTELAAGEYTLCWEAEGYYSGHDNLTVNEAEISVVKHMLPVLTEQKAYVLIEWDSDRDLDLCVFNAQTKQYINIRNAVDDEGDFLYFDNGGADGYELIYLNDYTAGIYTVYVRDGESLLQGTGSTMEADGLMVSIYTADGLLYRERASAAESAALWSPVYLYQGEAIALEDYIYDTTSYAWAVSDKGEAHEHTALAEATCTESSVCSVCGEKLAEPLGHIWRDATCIVPKTCIVCDAQEGGLGEHTAGTEATYWRASVCSLCGASVGEPLTPAFEREGIIVNAFSGGTYDYQTVSYGGNRTVGRATFSESSETLWGDGYSTISGSILIKFTDSEARRNGAKVVYGISDYYLAEDFNARRESKTNGATYYFSVDYDGKQYSGCYGILSLSYEQPWYTATVGGIETWWTVQYEFYLPTGYDGCVICFLDGMRSQQTIQNAELWFQVQ